MTLKFLETRDVIAVITAVVIIGINYGVISTTMGTKMSNVEVRKMIDNEIYKEREYIMREFRHYYPIENAKVLENKYENILEEIKKLSMKIEKLKK